MKTLLLLLPLLCAEAGTRLTEAPTPPPTAITVQRTLFSPPPRLLPVEADGYGLLAGGTIDADPEAIAAGNAGAVSGAGATVYASGTVTTGSTAQTAVTQLVQTRQYCAAQPASALSGTLSGATIAPGYHVVTGSATLTTGTTLHFTRDTAAVTVVHVTGDLSLESNSAVLLEQNRPGNVYWVVDGNVALEDGASFPGVVLAGGDVQVQGRHYGTTALLTEGNIMLQELDPLDGLAVRMNYWDNASVLVRSRRAARSIG